MVAVYGKLNEGDRMNNVVSYQRYVFEFGSVIEEPERIYLSGNLPFLGLVNLGNGQFMYFTGDCTLLCEYR